jgi:hypothetical protein
MNQPPQEQNPHGDTGGDGPSPQDLMTGYVGRGLLDGRVALVTDAEWTAEAVHAERQALPAAARRPRRPGTLHLHR